MEMEELKNQVRRLQAEVERRERRRLSVEDEALRKLKKQEEANNELKRCLDTKKQVSHQPCNQTIFFSTNLASSLFSYSTANLLNQSTNQPPNKLSD